MDEIRIEKTVIAKKPERETFIKETKGSLERTDVERDADTTTVHETKIKK